MWSQKQHPNRSWEARAGEEGNTVTREEVGEDIGEAPPWSSRLSNSRAWMTLLAGIEGLLGTCSVKFDNIVVSGDCLRVSMLLVQKSSGS